MADQVLDARGLNCPLPILKTKKAINKMESGQVLEVLSTDAGSVKDLEAFCNQTGNKLLETVEDDGKYTFTIEKA
ncbi:MAG: sulfurtransferase TusA family protein [Candidatus Marinimicrobia bacterium]|jgi:tRNA 2-thiouridine synthesizing protein A|nr:sulfurtransferase TusA family protein [Candidatus Neomarinimicrobiota bacterium]